MLKKLILPLVMATLLNACSATQESNELRLQNVSLGTSYDYQLMDGQKQAVNLDQLLRELADYDAVFIGEYHKNHASHLLQSQVLSGLYKLNAVQGRDTVLSMEMFERDHQVNLNKYLKSDIGETYLIKETPAWDNYVGSYRPLVEFAKEHNLQVIAANAPGDIVRCIGRHGQDYLNKLNDAERTLIAEQPFLDVDGYAKKFYGLMGISEHMPSNRMRNTYLAQLTRDNTMAESMTQIFFKNSHTQIIHVNGTFHSEDGLGTVGAFKRQNPNLKVAVVTPLHINKFEDADEDNYYYLVNKQPAEFVNDEYKKEAYKKMFSESKSKSCK